MGFKEIGDEKKKNSFIRKWKCERPGKLPQFYHLSNWAKNFTYQLSINSQTEDNLKSQMRFSRVTKPFFKTLKN